MTEHFEEEGIHQVKQSDWDRAIKEAERLFALQPTIDELESPYTSWDRKQEIYRLIGAVLFVVSIPVVAVVAARKISQILRKRNEQSET